MASRREEQARRRAERLEAERRAAAGDRRRLIVGYVVAGLLSAAVVVGLVIALSSGGDDGPGQIGGKEIPEAAAIEVQSGHVPDVPPDGREGAPPAPLEQGDLEVAAEDADCDLQVDLPDEGNGHFSDEDKEVDYKTSPPTSGDHYGVPTENGTGALADGAYLETPPLTRVLHSLEHGRTAIQYSPDLPEAEQLELKGLFDEDPAGMLLFPNEDMPYEVAATAWTQLLGCERYDDAATIDAIRAFRVTYRGQGPEPVTLDFPG